MLENTVYIVLGSFMTERFKLLPNQLVSCHNNSVKCHDESVRVDFLASNECKRVEVLMTRVFAKFIKVSGHVNPVVSPINISE